MIRCCLVHSSCYKGNRFKSPITVILTQIYFNWHCIAQKNYSLQERTLIKYTNNIEKHYTTVCITRPPLYKLMCLAFCFFHVFCTTLCLHTYIHLGLNDISETRICRVDSIILFVFVL